MGAYLYISSKLHFIAMKNITTTLLLLLGSLHLTLGQSDTEMMQNLRDDFNYGEFKPGANHVYYGVKQGSGKVSGDIYLDKEWRKGITVFYSDVVKRYDPQAPDSIAGYNIRVDLSNHYVEYDMKEGVKAVEENTVKRLYLTSPDGNSLVKLVNTREFGNTSPELKGFVELISTGPKLTVVKYVRLAVKEPTYNVALDVGEKDAKIYKKNEYYYLQRKGSKQVMVKFKPGKKTVLELMRDRKSKMEAFIDDQKLNLRQEADLRQALNHYNQQPTTNN